LLQKGADDALHPVAYESSKQNSSQKNYPAQEQELLAIILYAWRKWCIYLDRAVETTIVYTDHALLVYLSSQNLSSKRLVRWLDEFSEMDIDDWYKQGVDNVDLTHYYTGLTWLLLTPLLLLFMILTGP
jgi:hypothetical protein